jgi:hypothetical protein
MTKATDVNPTYQRVIEIVEKVLGLKYVFVIKKKTEYGMTLNFIEMRGDEKQYFKLNTALCEITTVACKGFENDRGWVAVHVPYVLPEGRRGQIWTENLAKRGITIEEFWIEKRLELNKKLGIKLKSPKRNSKE